MSTFLIGIIEVARILGTSQAWVLVIHLTKFPLGGAAFYALESIVAFWSLATSQEFCWMQKKNSFFRSPKISLDEIPVSIFKSAFREKHCDTLLTDLHFFWNFQYRLDNNELFVDFRIACMSLRIPQIRPMGNRWQKFGGSKTTVILRLL